MKIPFQKKPLIFFLCIAMICSCSKGESNDPKEPEEAVLILPGKPVGVLPANAETCSDFEAVPGETDKATILFSWSAAENASSYLVTVFESDTEVSSATVTITMTELTLEKGKSYSWTIKATNKDGETQSNTFSFTTPGEPIGNFAPYAAEISMDFNESNGELVVSWVGKDEDGDPLTYDVIVEEGDIIVEEHEDLTTVELNPITASAGVVYTVQVTSKDSFGNFSISTLTLKIED
jgi:heme/copper-type cytochrome/quinol oxidase subunit 2